jgi:hypothetical protein
MNNKKTAKSWLILGVVFIIILFIVAFLINSKILIVSYGASTLISAVFGFGGAIFMFVGIVKFLIEKFRK